MFLGERVLAIVPARSGSKAIKNKNIVDLGGKPLLGWTIEAAKNCSFIDDIAISSDNEKILSIAENNGATIKIKRPDHLATDESKSIDVVLHALSLHYQYSWYVLLQPTSPFRNNTHIEEAFNLLSSHKSESLVSLKKSNSKPNHIFNLDELTKTLNPILGWEGLSLPRQKLSNFYELNGAIYIGKTADLKKTKTFFTANTLGYIMDDLYL